MKKRFTFMLILFILILTSCTDAAVIYRLNDDDSINIEYIIKTTADDQNISTYADDTASYWEQMGFSADISNEDDAYIISGDKTIRCDSMDEAVSEFSSILTDEDSFLYDVTFEYEPAYFEDNYSLSASVSLKDIIRLKTEQDIPLGEIEALLDSAANGKYSLTLSIPGEVVATNADEQRKGACTWLLAYGQVTQIELQTKVVFEENIENYEGLLATQRKDDMLILICSIAAGVLLLAVIAFIVIRKVRHQNSA